MKLGTLIEDTSANQLSYYVIRNLNLATSDNEDEDFVVFFENATPNVIQPAFAVMNSSEIWNFDGVLISTTAANTLLSINAIAPAKKFFYVWDLEWTRSHGKDFDYMIKAYKNKEGNLIARSDDHAKAIKNYCNRDVCGIVSNFNINQLMEIVK